MILIKNSNTAKELTSRLNKFVKQILIVIRHRQNENIVLALAQLVSVAIAVVFHELFKAKIY